MLTVLQYHFDNKQIGAFPRFAPDQQVSVDEASQKPSNLPLRIPPFSRIENAESESMSDRHRSYVIRWVLSRNHCVLLSNFP